jgi:hypothetical protein
MSAHPAKIVDLQAYRSSRAAAASNPEPAAVVRSGIPVVWMPVWFVPCWVMPLAETRASV